MRVLYTPRDGEHREWKFEWLELSSTEAEAVEDVLDVPYPVFVGRVLGGHTRSRRALLWMLLRRTNPTLAFDDVEFRIDELRDADDDPDEAAAALDEALGGEPGKGTAGPDAPDSST